MKPYQYVFGPLLLCGACHAPPFVRKPIPLTSMPFEYGTNAVLKIDRQIDTPGVYDLHVKFRKSDIPLDTHGRWPDKLKTAFQVFVATNGLPANKKDLEALDFNSSQDPKAVRYGLATFPVAAHTRLTCTIADAGNGTLRMRGLLVLEQRFPK
jgi:hypothetical protein